MSDEVFPQPGHLWRKRHEIPPSTYFKHIREGRLKPVKIEGRHWITREQHDAFFARSAPVRYGADEVAA